MRRLKLGRVSGVSQTSEAEEGQGAGGGVMVNEPCWPLVPRPWFQVTSRVPLQVSSVGGREATDHHTETEAAVGNGRPGR